MKNSVDMENKMVLAMEMDDGNGRWKWTMEMDNGNGQWKWIQWGWLYV